jgi:hypothetical protein
MSELLGDIKKDLGSLEQQLEGASYMLSDESPHYKFLKYVQRCILGMHDKIGFEIKANAAKQTITKRIALEDINK